MSSPGKISQKRTNLSVGKKSKSELISANILRLYHRHIFPRIKNYRGAFAIRRFFKKFISISGYYTSANILETAVLGPSDNHQFLNLYTGYDPDEIENIRFILDRCEEDEVFVDVGSFYGLYSQIIHEKTKANCISFEPSPNNYKTQKLNNLIFNRDVTIINKGCGNKTGVGTFSIDKTSNGHGKMFKDENTESQIETEVTTLDNEIEHADHIKIDVEGFEGRVIEGSERILENTQTLLVELHPSLLRKQNESEKEVIEKIQEQGFEVKRLGDHLRCIKK
jgi:FkbM family methyltransferase